MPIDHRPTKRQFLYDSRRQEWSKKATPLALGRRCVWAEKSVSVPTNDAIAERFVEPDLSET